MLGILSITLTLAAGVLVALAFDPVRGMRPRWAAVLFTACLGILAGAAADSIVFLILAVGGIASAIAVFVSDAILLCAAVALYVRTKRTATAAAIPSPAPFRYTWLLVVVFAVTLLIVAGRLAAMTEANPWGGWDALAMWNLRAKFLAGAPGDWHYAVNGALADRMHPDYPLLLPSLVAAGWKAGGEMDTLVPVFVSFLFWGVLIALLVSAVAMLRGAASALLSGLVILATTSFLLLAPSQYADIPLACYWLGAVALLLIGGEASRTAAVWAGVCAGYGAWTKNEGIAFLAWFVLALLVLFWWKRGRRAAMRQTVFVLAGAIPGILLTLWLKFVVAPPADTLVRQSQGAMLAKITDAGRYVEIAKSFIDAVLHLGMGVGHPLILLAILAVVLRWNPGRTYRPAMAVSAAALGLMFLADIGAYLITPSDLNWQLGTSFDRLILQLWPSTLLVCFAAMGSLADNSRPTTETHSARPPQAARAKKKRK